MKQNEKKVEIQTVLPEVAAKVEPMKVSQERLDSIRKAITNRGKYNRKNNRLEAGYKYRWANTRNDKYVDYEDTGYEKVMNENGDTVSLNAGRGETQILMRVPLEISDVIDEVKNEAINQMEASVDPEKREELYGNVEITIQDKINMKKRLQGK